LVGGSPDRTFSSPQAIPRASQPAKRPWPPCLHWLRLCPRRGPAAVSLADRRPALLLQILLAAALLKLPPFKSFFLALNDLLQVLERATMAGTSFVFGYLGGAPAPYLETGHASSFVLAFRALPLVLVVSALSSLLFYWRVPPGGCGWFPSCCGRLWA
jgi:CNT family concentrative nucleoside transporter